MGHRRSPRRLLVPAAALSVLAGCGGTGPAAERREPVDPGGVAAVELQSALDAQLPADEPGCVVAVGEGGRTLAVAARGVADLDTGEPLRPDTVFDVASISKQFTGALVTLLIEDGTLTEDTPISEHIAGLSPDVGAVTVRQLLVQTSGLPDYVPELDQPFTAAADNDDVLAWLRTVPAPSTQPGAEWAYSNTNYVLLAEVAAAATGRSFDELLAERVLAPTGTTATLPDMAAELRPGIATSYADGTTPAVWRWNQHGDGRLHTTAPDLVAWGHELVTGDVLGPAWAAAMVSEPADAGELGGYGHGVFVGPDGLDHDGSWQAFASSFIAAPATGDGPDRTWVVLCNRDDRPPTELLDEVLAATDLPRP